ncbi:MAG: methionine--tRNA ligase [bacterium]|nr:methionine--tRNA ligase [bacterium]MDZ4341434.1 methionine--tRNA ligase [Candidatus Binatia bacterium]
MKYYVTTPIYYVNAKPHIGSAYPTIAADVLARWHKIKGDDTFFLTGVAEHGTKIANSAEATGQAPQSFVDTNSEYFKTAWETLGIQYDDFIRTTESRHAAAVTNFFKKLKESGQLYEAEYAGLYCVGHEAFIKESELDEHGNCPDHGQPPEKTKEKNWFFKLSEYGDFLQEKITSGQLQIEPVERKNEVLSFIEQGLEDIAISRRTAKFALPLPWDASQTIYVWLDELFNYCSAIGYGKDEAKFNKWWPADVHIVGKDIIKFHCVIWPALLEAIGEKLPKKVFAHGFFTIDGQKISKSLGNAIDPVELSQEYGSDAIRYFLLRDIPFGKDGDFSPERLKERYNADLANGLGNLVSRTLNMIERFTPELDPDLPVASSTLVQKLLYEAGILTENLDFSSALENIWQALGVADKWIEDNKPWELAKQNKTKEIEGTLAGIFSILVAVNNQIAPFLPETHAKLTKLLEARPIKKPQEPLFARKS